MDTKDRKRIGIFLTYNKIALGEIIYIVNLIKSIALVCDNKKPSLVLFYDEDNIRFVKEIQALNYPYIEYQVFNFHRSKIKLYIKSYISFKNLFIQSIHSQFKLNALFAVNDFPFKPKAATCKFISWIPDFQHKFYPQYFTWLNRVFRDLRFTSVAKNTDMLVLSSHNAKQHFQKYYDKQQKVKTKVLQFNSLIDEDYNYNTTAVLEKYNLHQPYFIVCNQFYEHKNHILVFKAIHHLNQEGVNCKVVFTGRMEDYRNPKFIDNLKQYLSENGLESNCVFLNVIPRNEQLSLMKQSLAVIQPSKFEGWSTVIEDAKSLQVQILSSSIDVHQEQLQHNAYYFDIDKAEQLAELMKGYLQKTLEPKQYFNNYGERIKNFANNFLEILN